MSAQRRPSGSARKRPPVRAAGAVVWRPDPVTGPGIVLVHRPKYDDWSLPKGKVDPGEHPLACAVREVEEETGHRIRLDRPLPTQRYLTGGKPKEVQYWAARADPNPRPREPDDEIDEIVVLPVADALARLTHRHDADLVTALLRGPLETRTIVVLRHTDALARDQWSGEDRDRPLDRTGRAAAERLVPPLRALGVTAIVSSPAVRCRDSVEPLAAALGLHIDLDEGLSEEGFIADDGSAMRARAKSAVDQEVVVLCTHRPILPGLLKAVRASSDIRRGKRLAPGEFVVVNHVDGAAVSSARYQV